jgi:predicted DCC family thiol-disulfide oxidoreductase YuxK
VDYHEALEQQREPLPSEETLAHALCAVTADRIQLSGVDALLAILRACGYRRTARLLSLPGLRTLARLVYRFVAAHRSSISRILFGGCDREGACRL